MQFEKMHVKPLCTETAFISYVTPGCKSFNVKVNPVLFPPLDDVLFTVVQSSSEPKKKLLNYSVIFILKGRCIGIGRSAKSAQSSGKVEKFQGCVPILDTLRHNKKFGTIIFLLEYEQAYKILLLVSLISGVVSVIAVLTGPGPTVVKAIT
uniref:Uncharacterized protein n=1 Tax=Romanomermis culicivorax TaxID=13658 RepID=A0A915KZE4_ROMCU